jgi:hypothetical protein
MMCIAMPVVTIRRPIASRLSGSEFEKRQHATWANDQQFRASTPDLME